LAQVVEHLPSKQKVLNSNLTIEKKNVRFAWAESKRNVCTMQSPLCLVLIFYACDRDICNGEKKHVNENEKDFSYKTWWPRGLQISSSPFPCVKREWATIQSPGTTQGRAGAVGMLTLLGGSL
jgi:hypothetical protein